MDIAEVVINTRKEIYEHRMKRPRIPFEILFAVGGWSAGSPTNFIETYDTRYTVDTYTSGISSYLINVNNNYDFFNTLFTYFKMEILYFSFI